MALKPGDAPMAGVARKHPLAEHRRMQREKAEGRALVWVRRAGRKVLVDRATGRVVVSLAPGRGAATAWLQGQS